MSRDDDTDDDAAVLAQLTEARARLGRTVGMLLRAEGADPVAVGSFVVQIRNLGCVQEDPLENLRHSTTAV